MDMHQRILVVGCPGGGKSFFSRALAEMTGLPLVHLDLLYWNSDRTTVSRTEFDEKLARVLATDRWIIDGNYGRTQPIRMDAADLVFFFDMPTEVCLAGIEERRGKVRPDMPWVETGESDADFLALVHDFHDGPRAHILARLFERPHLPVITFRSRDEVNTYLSDLRTRCNP